MRKKAMLAMMFFGGVLNYQLPVNADTFVETPQEMEQRIVREQSVPPEWRAYFLLILASKYLAGTSSTEIGRLFGSDFSQASRLMALGNGWQTILQNFANSSAVARHKQDLHVDKLHHANHQITSIERKLAVTAIGDAVELAEQTTDKYAKLNLMFVASCLFTDAGDKANAKKCDAAIDAEIQSCKSGHSLRPDRIGGIVAVFDARSFAHIQLDVSDMRNHPDQIVPQFTASDFETCEKLKLQGLEIADLLPPDAHVRRMAHRNLALWYKKLGKTKQADREKHALFQLVGFESEDVLFPQFIGCGRAVWWEKQKLTKCIACGMG